MNDDIQKCVRSVDGGVAKSLDEIVRDVLNKELEELEELSELDDEIFTCTDCGWTMPREEESENEPDVCIECDEE